MAVGHTSEPAYIVGYHEQSNLSKNLSAVRIPPQVENTSKKIFYIVQLSEHVNLVVVEKISFYKARHERN